MEAGHRAREREITMNTPMRLALSLAFRGGIIVAGAMLSFALSSTFAHRTRLAVLSATGGEAWMPVAAAAASKPVRRGPPAGKHP